MVSCFLPRMLAGVLGKNLIRALELNCFLWVTVEVEINSYATSRENEFEILRQHKIPLMK